MRLRNPLTKFKPKIRSRTLICKSCGDPYVAGNFDECADCLYPLEGIVADAIRDVMTASLYAEKSLLAALMAEQIHADPIVVCGRPFELVWDLEPQEVTYVWVEDRLNPVTAESTDAWLRRIWEVGR